MRVAIIHDWLLGMRGGERVLEVLCRLFPDAEIFTAFCRTEKLSAELASRRIHVSTFSKLPLIGDYYRHLLPFYPQVAASISRKLKQQSEMEGPFDFVLSVSHCLAKNVRVPDGVPHICYCLTPVRYIWDQYPVYFGKSALEPVISVVAKRLRYWDVAGSRGVDEFMGISSFICNRIEQYYSRESVVVYPPVDSSWILPREPGDMGEGFLCVSALVPYKNVELIVETFNYLPYQLTIVGDGPQRKHLERKAKGNIVFRRNLSAQSLAQIYRKSKALVFAAEEDFGMAPVEMQAAGRPVICFGRGGSLETVAAKGAAPTGIFFDELSVESLSTAISEFIHRQSEFTVDNCRQQADKFSLEVFERSFSTVLEASREGLGSLADTRLIASC